MPENFDKSKKTLELVRQFRNEMTIILHTSHEVVDRQTYEVFERAYQVSAAAASEIGVLMAQIEALQARAIPNQQ